MDPKEFSPSLMPGRLVRIKNGLPGVQVAFLPDPLPPRWQWPGGLWKLLVEARKSLSSLDGTGKHLPNPDILLQPLQSREAQLSSQLEGTITDPQQQVLFEAIRDTRRRRMIPTMLIVRFTTTDGHYA